MRITMVKKILADGAPCRKCADVEARLARGGHTGRIDRIVVADLRDPSSEGLALARQHGVELAPFFIVEREGEAPRVYTVYSQLLKEVLAGAASEADEEREILERGGVDFL